MTTQNKNQLRILLVDDHLLFAETLRSLLSSNSEVSLCELGMQALTQLDQKKFDIVLLDIDLPDIDGCALLKLIQKLDTPPPVLMLSGADDTEIIQRAKSHGAKGFCHKSVSPQALNQAIAAIIAGTAWWSDSFEGRHSDDEASRQLIADRLGITTRQLQVLILMDEGNYNKLIADRLHISESTVKTHIAMIYRLLDAHTRTACLHNARQVGLLS